MKAFKVNWEIDWEMVQMLIEEVKDVAILRNIQGSELLAFESFVDKIWRLFAYNFSQIKDIMMKGYGDAVCDMAAICKGIANAYKYCKDHR
jgi:hypothetical protein